MATKLREAQVAALIGAGLTKAKIAEVLGVSKRTVDRAAAEISNDMCIVDDLLARAQVRVRQLMPVEQRIEEIVRIAEQARDTNQFSAALTALQRLDDIDGLRTEKDLARDRVDATTNNNGPMFILPAGSAISVTVSNDESRTIEVKAEELCADNPPS